MKSCSLLKILALLATFIALPSLTQAAEEEEFFEFDEEETSATIADPLEGFNRVSFALNDKLYRGVLKPFARTLRLLPAPVRRSLGNFFTNLGAPVSSASALLQGDVRNASTEMGRFLLNTTAGLGGFLDPATGAGLVLDEEDLGQTMARWRIGHGFYLVVPLYGPSSLRDVIGSTATSGLNPLFADLEGHEIVTINLLQAEVALSLDQDTYEAFYDSALDPYVFFRSAWAQNRQGKIEK